jgi:hypothetical protein
MELPLRTFRSAARWLAPAFALLLFGVVVLGSSHHHDPLDGRHPCAVCTAANAPAITSGSAPAPSAPVAFTRHAPRPELAPRARRVARDLASRAPPSA